MDIIDLETAYKWLHQFDPSPGTFLSPPTAQMVLQMNTALKARDSLKVCAYIERLIRISDTLKDEKEIAETRLECGRAYYAMRSLQDAIRLFSEAVGKFNSYPHQYAVSQWMLGYILWQVPDRHDDAIVAWQRSRNKFEELARRYSTTSAMAKWYTDCAKQMSASLQFAISRDGLPDNVAIDLIEIVESIPAGWNLRKDSLTYAGDLTADQFIIDGQLHWLRNVGGIRPIHMKNQDELIVLKVKGDTMNQQGIYPGSYVLLHITNSAMEGDIVASIVPGLDKEIALRRHTYKGWRYVLQHESDNSNYHDIDPPYDIYGVVRGVFVPI